MNHYAAYNRLKLARSSAGVLEIALGDTTKLPIVDELMHRELTTIWRDVDSDMETRSVLMRGSAKGFTGGGSIEMVQKLTEDNESRLRVLREARDLVHNMINCSKPVVAAVNGPAAGVGLAIT